MTTAATHRVCVAANLFMYQFNRHPNAHGLIWPTVKPANMEESGSNLVLEQIHNSCALAGMVPGDIFLEQVWKTLRLIEGRVRWLFLDY